MKWAAPHPCVVVEDREGYLSYGGPPSGPNIAAPPWAPQSRLSVPGRGVTTTTGYEKWGFYPDEMEGCWKPRCPLQGPAHRLTSSQKLTFSSSKGIAAQKTTEKYREELNCVASG